jgi:Zn-dependent protease
MQGMDSANLIQTLAVNALPVLFAITLHEAAHAFAAKRLGDNTAYLLGRVSLNPARHIDPLGTILIPLLSYLAISFPFGYAKPVPVRFDRLRHPKRDMVWVALAGPGANFLQALLWGAVFLLLDGAEVQEAFFIEMCQAGIRWNLILFAFNLFPIPPLDGGRVLVGLLPYQQANWVARLEPWGFFIVLALAYTGVAYSVWLGPLLNVATQLLNLLLMPLAWLVH